MQGPLKLEEVMKVTIERSGWLCQLEPWIPVLEQHLTYWQKNEDFSRPRKKGQKMQMVQRRLYEVKDDQGVFPAGLFTRVILQLQEQGVEWELKDYRQKDKLWPEPDFGKVHKLRSGQSALLLAVTTSDGGLIVGGTGVGKSFIIIQICRMYPTLRFLITSPRKAVVEMLTKKLTANLMPGAVGMITGDRNDGPDHRITVTTTKSVLKANLNAIDVLLFDEAHGVGNNQIAKHLSYLQNTRRYGFTASAVRGDGSALAMEAVFGPVLAEIPYDEAVDKGLVVPIEVHVYPNDIKVEKRRMIVANKRHGYWRNNYRNKLIREIVRRVPDYEQTLIMTETLEHANYLHELLPEYTLVHFKIKAKELKDLREQFERGELKKVISTTTWKEGVDFPHLSVLVRADGASSEVNSIQIPGRLSRIAENKNVGVLIDFADNFNEWGHRRYLARLRTYKERKWDILKKTAPAVKGR